jgi:hypothetical protein
VAAGSVVRQRMVEERIGKLHTIVDCAIGIA